MREAAEEILHFQCGHSYTLPLNIGLSATPLRMSCSPEAV